MTLLKLTLLKRKRSLLSFVALVLVIVTAGGFLSTALLRGSAVTPETRTVALQGSGFDYQGLLDDFDEHNLVVDESGLKLVAKKNFGMSIFDELDLVGINENEETVTVRYEIDYIASEDTMLMTVIIEGLDEIPVLETIPGLVVYNADGVLDVMFVIDGEFVWLSDMYEAGLLDEVGLFSALKALVAKAVSTVVNAVVAAAAAV
ncbi:MAG: hypothetical protein LBT20_06320, partial [Clostridiales bacterium]|nr:hypothetical protein [Clostridiales bacterium]